MPAGRRQDRELQSVSPVSRTERNHMGSGQVLMTGVSLEIPAHLSFEDWERAGHKISGLIDSSAWWLGDWLVYGKTNYADRYQHAVRAVGLRYQTLRNYAWVARRFNIGRRRAALTFQHHAEVASLPVEEQEKLLTQAELETWTTKQLRIAARDNWDGSAEGSSLQSTNSRIEMPKNRLDTWRKAADCAGVDFTHWIQSNLDRAAMETLREE